MLNCIKLFPGRPLQPPSAAGRPPDTAVAPHRFESKYLVVPSRPSGHERVDPALPLRYAMLVDTSLFELSGLTCDKIGVSFTAFKRQVQQCVCSNS